MPSPLNESDALVFLHNNTEPIQAIPVGGSIVVSWAGRYVLVYHTMSGDYFYTDISDLPAGTIQELARQSYVAGFVYFLPSEIVGAVKDAVEGYIEVGQATVTGVANMVGDALNKAVGPTVGSLTVPLVVLGVIALIYLFKKG